MIDYNKMDEKDFVFISKPKNTKSDKAFSEFLKSRIKKTTRTRLIKKSKSIQSS
jgi:hypothetical protein